MLGNVLEWCEDWAGSYTANKVKDPRGPAAGSNRLGRGGSWFSYARDVRAAPRSAEGPEIRHDDLGFRLARGPAPSQEAVPPNKG